MQMIIIRAIMTATEKDMRMVITDIIRRVQIIIMIMTGAAYIINEEEIAGESI